MAFLSIAVGTIVGRPLLIRLIALLHSTSDQALLACHMALSSREQLGKGGGLLDPQRPLKKAISGALDEGTSGQWDVEARNAERFGSEPLDVVPECFAFLLPNRQKRRRCARLRPSTKEVVLEGFLQLVEGRDGTSGEGFESCPRGLLQAVDVVPRVSGAVVGHDGRKRQLRRDPGFQDLQGEWGAEVQVLICRSFALCPLDHRVHAALQVDDTMEASSKLLIGVRRTLTSGPVGVGAYDGTRGRRNHHEATGRVVPPLRCLARRRGPARPTGRLHLLLPRRRRGVRSSTRRLRLLLRWRRNRQGRLPGQLGLEALTDSCQMLHLSPEFRHLLSGYGHSGSMYIAGCSGGDDDDVKVLEKWDGSSLNDAEKGALVGALGRELRVEKGEKIGAPSERAGAVARSGIGESDRMGEMSGKLGRWRHLQMVLFLCSVPLQLSSGQSIEKQVSVDGLVLTWKVVLWNEIGTTDDPSNSKDGKTTGHSKSNNSTGLDVLYACLGVVAVVLLAVFLFKLWQKKKREEQHARLLRLFEEDDELELELGLRD
ncbi:hypothetical protein Taro_049249 [Colocasia esculenta]|uniref:Uncharacterized protein n=1 Tax=Colocasia esculenta TaxID=4460 RepID=A0A843XAE2_COLES|nr:hypothetical protein [Colocasia esculenta]